MANFQHAVATTQPQVAACIKNTLATLGLTELDFPRDEKPGLAQHPAVEF